MPSSTIPAVRRGPAPVAPRSGPAGSKVPLRGGLGKSMSGSLGASRGSSASNEQLEAAQQELDVLREQVGDSSAQLQLLP